MIIVSRPVRKRHQATTVMPFCRRGGGPGTTGFPLHCTVPFQQVMPTRYPNRVFTSAMQEVSTSCPVTKPLFVMTKPLFVVTQLVFAMTKLLFVMSLCWTLATSAQVACLLLCLFNRSTSIYEQWYCSWCCCNAIGLTWLASSNTWLCSSF